MPRLHVRDRFFTRPVARAITSPLGILLFGGATAVGIATGLGFFAPLVGLGAWAARVLFAVPRNKSAGRIDPYTLGTKRPAPAATSTTSPRRRGTASV